MSRRTRQPEYDINSWSLPDPNVAPTPEPVQPLEPVVPALPPSGAYDVSQWSLPAPGPAFDDVPAPAPPSMLDPATVPDGYDTRAWSLPPGQPHAFDTTAPLAPVVDVEGAEAEMRRQIAEYYQLSQSPEEAAARAQRIGERIRNRPEPIPAQPTLEQQARLSFLPRRRGIDQRPMSEQFERFAALPFKFVDPYDMEAKQETFDAAGQMGVGVRDGLLGVADRMGIWGAKQLREYVADKNVQTDEEGIPEESDVLALLRILGSSIPAVLTETVGRLPAPTLRRAGQNIGAAGKAWDDAPTVWSAMGAGARQLFDVPSLYEQITGAPAGSAQRVRREGFAADWLQGVLERIERGEGLERDFSIAAKNAFGDTPLPFPGDFTAEEVAWFVGLGADVVINWEGIAAKPATAALRTAARAQRIGELVPDTPVMKRLQLAVRDPLVLGDEWLADQAWRVVNDGGSIDDLPARWHLRAERIALEEEGMTLGELAQLEGVPRRRVEAPERGIEAPAATAAARDQALGRMGETGFEVFEAEPGAAPQLLQRTTTPRRTAPAAAEQRAVLPPFREPPRNSAEWWERAAEHYQPGTYPRGGYTMPRHIGYERIVGAADQLPDSPSYVLLNNRGDAVATGTFADLTERMLARAAKGEFGGDEIWYSTVRPVARWGPSSGVRDRILLRSDYWFSSPVERAMIEQLRRVDPRAVPPRLQVQVDGTRRARARVGEAMMAALVRAPRAGTDAPPRLRSVLRRAAELELRDMMGSHELRMLPGGGMVAAREWGDIMSRANARIGVAATRLRELIRQGPLEVVRAGVRAEELPRLQELARQAGLPADAVRIGEPLDVTTVLAIQRQAVKLEAGLLADARYRVRGMPIFTLALQRNLGLANQNRTKWSRLGRLLFRNGITRALAAGFFDSPLEGVAAHAQRKLRELAIRLERNSDDLIEEYAALSGDATPAQRLLAISSRYAQVVPVEVDVAARVRDAVTDSARQIAADRASLRAGNTVIAASERAAQLERAQLGMRGDVQRLWRGDRPTWLDSTDSLVYRQGLEAWSRVVLRDAAESGRRWLESAVMATGEYRHFGQSTIRKELQERVDDALGLRVYDEVYRGGALDGLATREALERASYPNTQINTTDALILHTLNLRTDDLVTRTMDELVYGGVVVRATDPRVSALNATALGEARRFNHETKAWEYRFSEAQVTWAHNQLADWGFDVGAHGGELVQMSVGRRAVVMPAQLGEYVSRLVDRGMLDSRAIRPGLPGYDTVMRAFKEWTTHGMILPNPSYFTGSMLSVLPTLLTTQGFVGTVRAGAAALRHPVVVGEMIRRMQGRHPGFVSTFLQPTLMTEAGLPVTVDAMVDAARRHGLADTATSFETNRTFVEMVSRDGPDYAFLDPRRLKLVGRALGDWQQMLRDFAGSFDLAAKLSVYTDLVRRGVPFDEAALQARGAMLDFRNLTEWEARHMRFVFTFYAFLRKNADAHMQALLTNPARVLGQMRLAHALVTEEPFTLLNAIEQGQLEDADIGRLVIYETDGVYGPGGRPNPRYRTNRLQSTPISVSEFLLSWRMLGLIGAGGSAVGGYRSDPGPMLGAMSPTFQIPSILLVGRKLDRTFESPAANRVPPVLLALPGIGDMSRWAFRVGPAPITPMEDQELAHPDATAELGAGQRGVWTAGVGGSDDENAAARQRWQAFKAFIGRPVSNLQNLSVVAGLEDPPPDVSWGQASSAYLVGLTWRSRLTEEATIAAQQNRTVDHMNRTTKEYKLPKAQP